MARTTIEVLRYTFFWRKLFLNDGARQPKIVGNFGNFFLGHDFGCMPRGQAWDFSPGVLVRSSFIFFPKNSSFFGVKKDMS